MVIGFAHGEIEKVNGQSFAHPTEAIQYIQSISKNLKLNPSNIIIGNGSDEIISLACQLF